MKQAQELFLAFPIASWYILANKKCIGRFSMKKLICVVLVSILCLSAVGSLASQENEIEPLRFIIECARLLDWKASPEDAGAYFEHVGFAMNSNISGTYSIGESEVSLFILHMNGAPLSVSLDVPNGLASLKTLSSYAEAIFGKMTKEAKRKSDWGWNTGGGISLSITKSNSKDKTTSIIFANFGEAIVGMFPLTGGEFSMSALSAATAAKASIVERREEALNAMPPFDFRNGVIWGMPKDEVITSEGRTPDEDDTKMIAFHNVKAGSFQAIVGYFFNDVGACYKAMYLLQEKHSTDNAYLDDYKVLKNSLTDRYGKPTEDEQIWGRDLYKSKPDRWGFAISLGDLSYYTVFETGDTTILLYMTGDNYEINTTLIYESKNIEGASPVQDNSL